MAKMRAKKTTKKPVAPDPWKLAITTRIEALEQRVTHLEVKAANGEAQKPGV